MPDLVDRGDVAELLDDFYTRAFADELLRPVFVDIAQMDLAKHIPAITDFWCKTVLHEGVYKRNVLIPHKELQEKAQMGAAHFERWLQIWQRTVDDRHSGPNADLAKLQAARIAFSMCRTVTGEIPTAIGQQLADGGHPLGAHHPASG
ncbi:MAG: group III truncated hemoglobin [Gordonia sp. (in: high G+C Gram-positive bacteria)]|uniref:group III truncated hemoglobin n=1 Tax=Gordonia sp. (in: high G+C Gram-positive bacteria) TaxID=84139 RepID=UPI0039E24FAC